MIESKKRFLVALSFPGEDRERVRDIARLLASDLGEKRILYDKFHEADFARPNLDTYLQDLYHNDSELIVVFLSGDYERKEWPGLEWRAIRDLIKRRQASVMFIRVDDADISGLFSIDGYVAAEGKTPSELAALIIARLGTLEVERQEGDRGEKKLSVPQPVREAINRGVDCFNAGHFAKAKVEFAQAVILAQEANNSLAIVDAKEHLALVLIHFEHDVVNAKALLQSCLEILTTEDCDEERADVLTRLAHIHEEEGDLELSESLQRQSLAISKRLKNSQAQAGTLVNLAWTLGRRGRTDEALTLNLSAYELLMQSLHETKPDDARRLQFSHTVLGNLFFQRAKIHQRRADPDAAETALMTALEWQRKVPANHELAKLLCELAELRFFKQQWSAGAALLQEGASLYKDRGMLPEFAKCLHMMGRVHAGLGNFDKAGEFFSDAATVASQCGPNQEAAEILLSLAHLALEQRDSASARRLFEYAKEVANDVEFQAKCIMELAHLAGKEGREDERQKRAEEAVDLLSKEMTRTKPEMDRAKQYFTIGLYLREAGKLDQALSSVRKAQERFEKAGDAYNAAKASFEIAGLLDHMGRKKEAREICFAVLKIIEDKPFFEIAAAVDLSIARFLLHDDKDLREAERFIEHGLALCKEHDLPLLPEALLLKDELEHIKQVGTDASATLISLIDDLHRELALCPANSDGYVRLWAFCHWREIGSMLRASLGPSFAIFVNTVSEFVQLSSVLRPYRDLSLVVPTEKYPENIVETIPFAEEMHIPAQGIAFLLVEKESEAYTSAGDRSDRSNVRYLMEPDACAEMAVSSMSHGGAIPRYFFVPLPEDSQEFGRARGGAQGESLALPPAVHELLQATPAQELKENRLFFIYYNRGLIDEGKRFWYDLAILHEYRCIPVYKDVLPQSEKVRVVASCLTALPVLNQESSEKHKRSLRQVRRALLELLTVDESSVASKLSDLIELSEDLADEIVIESSVQLALYVLSFELEGTKRIHAAIVLK